MHPSMRRISMTTWTACSSAVGSLRWLGSAGRSLRALLTHAYERLCQYRRLCLESSKKHEAAAEAGGARGDALAVGTCTVVLDGYWTRPEPLKVSSRAAKVARMLGFSMPAR